MSPPNLPPNDHECDDDSIDENQEVDKTASETDEYANDEKKDDDVVAASPCGNEPNSSDESLNAEKDETSESLKGNNDSPKTLLSTSKAVSFREPIVESECPSHQLTRLPVVSLSHGLNRKVTPLALSSWVALSLTLDGRDKITKVVQYASRFLAWWFSRNHLSSAHAQRFKALYTQVAKSRKAFRLGRSLIEVEKLRQMGLAGVVLWHLRLALNHDDASSDQSRNRPHLPRKASSNIGWGPSTIPESLARSRSVLFRSLSSIGYRMYRPMISRLSSMGSSTQTNKAPMWKIIGTSLKLLGLLGFWAGDNVSFLTSTGFLDNYSLEESKRVSRRKRIQNRAVVLAFRSYFMGALAGLVVNLRTYWSHRQNEMKSALEQLQRAGSGCGEGSDDDSSVESCRRAVKRVGEKQFVLFLALLKSCCDVLVFSNNTGIDLHKKYRGKKMHEGFHCLCGLISASTVLYNNYPNDE